MMETLDSSKLTDAINKLIEHEDLINAINNHALPRLYDYEILRVAESSNKIALIAIFVSICVTVITAFLSWKIFKRQEKIMNRQADFAEEQNKIMSYDKKYEIYQFVFKTSKNINEQAIDKILGTLQTRILPYNKYKIIFSELFPFQISYFDIDEKEYEELINDTYQKLNDLIVSFYKINHFYSPNVKRKALILEIEIVLRSIWSDIFCCPQDITKEKLYSLLKINELMKSLEEELGHYADTSKSNIRS